MTKFQCQRRLPDGGACYQLSDVRIGGYAACGDHCQEDPTDGGWVPAKEMEFEDVDLVLDKPRRQGDQIV